MSVSPSPRPSRSAIVTRLRAAGCVFAEDEARVAHLHGTDAGRLAAMVDRRVAGLPLEHVLGWAEFCGLRIAVDPGVFVPRRRTEFLVGQAAALAGPRSRRRRPVLRLGRGGRRAGRRRWTGSSCTPPTSTPPRCGAPAATSPPPVGRCTRATSTSRCPPTLRGRVDVLVANAPVRTHRGDRAAAPGGPRTRAAGGARRRRGRARRPAAGDRRGAAVAGAGRPPAGRDERAPGAAGRRGRRPRRADPAGGQLPTSWTPPSSSEPGRPW